MGIETILLVAEKYFPNAEIVGGEYYIAYKSFIEGAKWQLEVNQKEIDILKEELAYEKRKYGRKDR